jgi:uracil-DNA glycosylase family 4
LATIRRPPRDGATGGGATRLAVGQSRAAATERKRQGASLHARDVPVDAATLVHPQGRRLAIDRACRACRLCEARTQVVVQRGRLDARVLFVGEGPGAEEDARGEPFVGRSGKLLDRWIQELQLGDDWCITNIVRCRPPQNRKPKVEESDACWVHLAAFLGFVQPRVIVAVGGTAKAFLEGKGVPHLAVKHPSYFVRGFAKWQPEVARLRLEMEAALA